MQTDFGIDTLLDLNGNIIQQDNGYWVEIHTWRVEATSLIPHGVRYALTLHQQNGARVMGYDNAHVVKPSAKFKFAGQVLPYDHKHRNISDKGVPYEFVDAYCCRIFSRTLIESFRSIQNEKYRDRHHASRTNT